MPLPCRLADLEPSLKGTLEDGKLWLRCPYPTCDHMLCLRVSSQAAHWIQCQDSPGRREYVWQASGSFPDTLTLQPSVDVIEADAQGNKIRTLCWHGFISSGGVT